nr:MAG TPA: hypothetical protein [Caudoviricetes sp.]
MHDFLSKILRTLYGAEDIRAFGVGKCNYILCLTVLALI